MQGKKSEATEIILGKSAAHITRVDKSIMTMINISTDKSDSFFAEAKSRERQIIFLMAGLIVMTMIAGSIVSLLITRSIVKPLSMMVNTIREISQGYLKGEVKINSKDEIGILADSFRELQNDLLHKVQLAEHIASGDLNEDIPPRSEKDDLGKSFFAMTTFLRKAIGELKESGHYSIRVVRLPFAPDQIDDTFPSIELKSDVYIGQNVSRTVLENISRTRSNWTC